MKNIISLFLAFAMLLGMAACVGTTGNNEDDSATSHSEISETITVEPIDRIPNLIECESGNINTWSVDVVTNYIPFTPDGYKGTTADFVQNYTDKDGTKSKKTYHVAFFTGGKNYKAYQYDYAIIKQAKVDGKIKSGFFIMYTENLFFLECQDLAGNVQRYYLDINLPNNTKDAYVLGQNDDRALISAGSYIFVYKFEDKSCKLITKDALDYNYNSDGNIYFADWSHDEYACDWRETTESTKTGNQVIHYFNDNFNLAIDLMFTSNFKTIQKALHDGIANENYFKNNYIINSLGNIYDNSGYCLSNIHLPDSYTYNHNVIHSDRFGCWFTQDSTITYYRYGDVVKRYNLGNGLWKIIATDIEHRKDPNSIHWIGYDMDTNHDNILTAKELNDAMLSVQLLLYNAENHCIYISYDGCRPIKLTENVVDYCVAYSQLYWMNAYLEAYELSWQETMASILIGRNVVGISHHTDELAGFVVAPGDHRCNAINGGTSLCTLYGKEWLNQNQTSGAWALELDWD